MPDQRTVEIPASSPRNKLISSVWLDFGPPNDTFVAYHAEGGHYRTDFGVGMGSTEAALRQAVGNRLTSKLGQPPLSVRRGPDQLWFLLEAGRLWEIAGGHFRKCF